MSDPEALGGTVGQIPSIDIEPLFVAPATGKEKNTFRVPLIPIACWRLDDVRFEFDSSIVAPETQAAMKDFEATKTDKPSGSDTADNRNRLFAAYMDFLCVDAAGKPYQVQKSEFLAQDADKNGKGDVQGCGEFNPVLIFSIEDDKAFRKPALKATRDAKNAPNRRGTALLFRKGSVVLANRWPCPTTNEGLAKCKLRFWSDAAVRLAP